MTEGSWRPDSNVVAAASEDTTVRLFEMENGSQIRNWGAHGGGTLGVHSVLGQGSSFWLELPLAPPEGTGVFHEEAPRPV